MLPMRIDIRGLAQDPAYGVPAVGPHVHHPQGLSTCRSSLASSRALSSGLYHVGIELARPTGVLLRAKTREFQACHVVPSTCYTTPLTHIFICGGGGNGRALGSLKVEHATHNGTVQVRLLPRGRSHVLSS